MKKLIVPALLAVLFAGCTPVETTRKDATVPAAGPGQRGAYALVPFEETIAVGVFNEQVLKGLENALAGAVEAKGYRRVKDGPDVLVALYVVREGKFQAHDWGYRYGWKTPEWDAYWLKTRASGFELPEGAMVIDVVDAGAKKHLWGGSSAPVLFPSAEGEVENREAEAAISSLLRDFR